jgi:hypothetical protein
MSGDTGMTIPRGFPTGFQYQEAVQHPERCFSDPDLRSASFERMAMGLPKMISGNFASVFPMTSAAGHQYAVKCFTREVSHQLQRYMLIGAYLSKLQPWWATDFQFIPEGIQVEGSRYPILRMNWVNGLTLARWISDNINRPAAIADLAVRFDHMISDLAAAGMAHGDLQAGNLLVADNGMLHLVDYDGMYVPGLAGLPAGEVGHPDYQPPGRCLTDYGPGMDRFSAWLISLSLKILAVDPGLWEQLNPGHDEYLLLNRSDLLDLDSSQRFSVLSSHQNAEVRRLANIARDILSLPLAAIPAFAAPSAADASARTFAPKAKVSGIPDWMRSHISSPSDPPDQSDPAPAGRRGRRHIDMSAPRLTWFARLLTLLPLVAVAGVAWDWRASLAVLVFTSFVVTISLWWLYRRNPVTRTFIELRQARRRAASGVSRAAREISQVKKETARIARIEQRLANQYAKKRASLQADFDRREGKAFQEIKVIDRKLAQLKSRRQHEIGRSLKELQQNYVRTTLSQTVIDANQVPGVGAQLVSKLRSIGIQSAADFVGTEYVHNGRSTAVYFRLATGSRMHVPGIGEVKARRIEQWRQAQVANTARLQPSALPPSKLQAIEAQFAAEERQLQERRTRLTGQIADKIAMIRRELDAALADAGNEYNAELIPVAQRKAELAAQLGQAHSGYLTAQQQFLDWDNRLAAARQPAFGPFVSAAIRG